MTLNNRMRKFMKIVETITNDMALNSQIEDALAPLPSGDRTKVLDGMEIVHGARGGINISGWAQQMREMWPGESTDELKRIWKLMTGHFPNLIHRGNDGYYSFSTMPDTPVAPTPDLDTTSPLAQMAKHQIEATATIQGIMRELGTFTPDMVEERYSANYGSHPEMAHALVQHVIDQSAASVKPNGNGSYSWHDPVAKTGLSFLQDLEGYQPRA